MLNTFLKRFFYTQLVGLAQSVTGVKPHYKVQYSLYLYGPRWFVLRNLRLWWDGWSCVDCGRRWPLDVHHTTYADKGKGWGVGEFLDLRTVCDGCHDRRHGR